MTLNDSQTSALEAALAPAGESAANTLSGLLGRTVVLTPAGVSQASAADLADKFFGGVAQVPVTVGGGVNGKALLVFNESSAALMADLLIGGDGSNPPEALSDLHLSAVGEVRHASGHGPLRGSGPGLGQGSGRGGWRPGPCPGQRTSGLGCRTGRFFSRSGIQLGCGGRDALSVLAGVR